MASQNYYNVSSSNSKYTGKFAITETNDTGGNYSTINWTFSLYRNDSYNSSYSRQYGNRVVIEIDGSRVLDTDQCGTVTAPNGEANAYVLASGSTRVNHNSDGTKQFSFSAQYTNSQSSSISPLTVSGTHTCNTIPRASSFTLSASSVAVGSNITVQISRASSTFSHRWSITTPNNTTVFLQDGIGTSHTAAVPLSVLAYAAQNNLSSVTLTAHVMTYVGTNTGNVVGYASRTFTATVPAAGLSLGASSVPMGSAVTLSASFSNTALNGENDLNYKFSFQFGSKSGQVASISAGGSKSVSFTPALATYAPQIPSATSGKGTVTCQTYCGTRLIGSATKQLTLTLPSGVSYQPTFTESLTPTGRYGNFYLKGRSGITAGFSAASAKYGATIASRKIFINSSEYTNSVSYTFPAAGSYTVTYRVTDSRGYQAEKTLSAITVHDYRAPQLSTFQVRRGDGAANTTLYLTCQGSYFVPASGTYSNTPTLQLSDGSRTFSVPISPDAGGTFSVSDWQLTENEETPSFSEAQAYALTLTLYDSVNGSTPAASLQATLPPESYLLDFCGADGVAIGKASLGSGLEVALPSRFYEGITLGDTAAQGKPLRLVADSQGNSFQLQGSGGALKLQRCNAAGVPASTPLQVSASGSCTLASSQVSGDLKVTGALTASGSTSASSLTASGKITAGSLAVTGSASASSLSTSGNISASGTISEGGKSLSSKYAAASHSHSYLPLSGGTVTGTVTHQNHIIFGLDKRIYWNNTSTGARIYSPSNQHLYFAGSGEALYYLHLGVHNNMWTFDPDVDTYSNLGTSQHRWSGIYSTSSSISTSDRNLKRDLDTLDAGLTEQFILGLKPQSYRFLQGESGRRHWGLIGQDVEELMEELGIDSMDFGGFIKSPKYEESTDEEGNYQETPLEGEYIYSLRYEEFIAPLVQFVQNLYHKVQVLEETVQKLRASQDSNSPSSQDLPKGEEI